MSAGHEGVGHSRLLARLRMKTSLDDIRSPYFWRAVFAEYVGTFLLVAIGCASTLNGTGSLGVSLCFGLAVATIVWSIAHVSGGHINPAVTLAMLVTRKISLVRGLLYIIVQMVGSMCAAGLLLLLLPMGSKGSGFTQLAANVKPEKGFGIELLITFVLVFTVFATCDSKRTDLNGSGPLAIGLSVTLCHIGFMQFTGSSMNPARSFGPAVVFKNMKNHWVYWVGPCLGGVIAGLLYEHVFSANSSLSRARAFLLSSRYDGADYEAVQNRDHTIEECPELDPQQSEKLVADS